MRPPFMHISHVLILPVVFVGGIAYVAWYKANVLDKVSVSLYITGTLLRIVASITSAHPEPPTTISNTGGPFARGMMHALSGRYSM